MKWHLLWLALASLSAAGCADPARNLYEGIQMRNESLKTPEERATSPRPPEYDEYKKERDKLEKDSN
jgi:hypothetical protein